MRLAILIIGLQNSGKTSTIKHLIHIYNGKKLKVMKAGWKNIFLNPIFGYLKLGFYCIPASPTETMIKLSTRFATWPALPEVIMVAEQAGGANFADTINFLTTNHYNILTYTIANTGGPSDWERFNTTNMTIKLDSRANEIVHDIKHFIRTNGII